MGAAIETREIKAIDPETGAERDETIAYLQPASDEAVSELLAADPELDDGFTRSQWLWVRLQNGDLILGFFPQDDGYFAHEAERGI